MQHKNYLSISAFIALSLATPAAHGWPFSRLLHRHPNLAVSRDSGISFRILNRSDVTQEIEIDGRRYTLTPNSSVALRAASGTQVISQNAGIGHDNGEVLFAVQPSLRNDTVTLH